MTNGGYLDKAAILAADDLVAEDVSVPEWGGVVRVRMMSGTERDQFDQWMVDNSDGEGKVGLQQMRATLAALTIIDSDGKRVFSQGEIEALGRKSAVALDRVNKVARRLNGIGKEAVEEIAKNSETSPSDASSSD